MTAKQDDNRGLAGELAAMLQQQFPGIEVGVEHSARWNRMCVTFRWQGFSDLLPEERFHRLASVIPAEFRDNQLSGFVWLEMAPDETVDAFLKLPRSEDLAREEPSIYAGLIDVVFFDRLDSSLGNDPGKTCPGDFSNTSSVLSAAGYSVAKITKAKCVFIRHGVYCDCQVLQSVRPTLAELHTGAA